jgi:hypothetical protein
MAQKRVDGNDDIIELVSAEPVAPSSRADSPAVFSTRFFHKDHLAKHLRPSLELLGRVCGSCGTEGPPTGFVDIDLFDGSNKRHPIPVCSRCADALADAEIQEQVAKHFFDCVQFLGSAGSACGDRRH